ncbi:unnamed protein product [Coregonus sp. 'balchen']|nr:unnamed protein product [Coregonus sp. 'balchen']
MTNRYTVHFYGSYLLYAVSLFLACLMVLQSNRVREIQVELRELRQWTSLVCGDRKESSADSSRCGVDEDDYTLVKWALGLSRLGEGLQVSGEKVTVVTEGTYFIYSQVLYKDTTWTMGHVIKKRLRGMETILMKCIQSMPSNITVAQNTCFTAGVHYLEPGSTLELSIPRKSAGLVLKPQSTFLGMFRI